MKRSKFFAAMACLAATPLSSFAHVKEAFRKRSNMFRAAAGEGRLHGHIQLKGVNSNVIDVKISGSDTDGDLAIFEQTSLSPGRGTPLHVHAKQDEIFYVLEGQYRFKCGDNVVDLSTGDSIFLPRQIPHAWTQVSQKGKMMVTLQPAGKLENFFLTMAGLDHEPLPEEIAKMFAENEMQVVGPPLKLE